ncbi:MAG: hypothetical protein H7841_02370 [Magnetospirillum sp. WYHS-4]
MKVRTFVSLFALVALLTGPSAKAAEPAAASRIPTDLIQDRPNLAVTAFDGALAAVGWTWGMVKSGLSVIAPPPPSHLARSVSEEDKAELFKLLNIAGYKLKEIDTQVGIIPTIAFKFAMIRELSAADIDFLDASLEKSKIRDPGLYTEVQRTIVGTVMAINSGDEFLVSELKVQLLPLPKVAFSVSPKVSALSEEGSALMRAIQKVDRKVMGVSRRVGSVPATASAPGEPGLAGFKLSDWLLGGALALLAIGLLIELKRQMGGTGLRPATALTYLLFVASGGTWMAYGHLLGSWPVLAGGGVAAALSLALAAQRLRGRRHGAEAGAAVELAPATVSTPG